MTWAAVKYDGEPVGPLARRASFTRNVATVSGDATPVSANVRRFCGKRRCVPGEFKFTSSGTAAPTNTILVAGGPDLDGTPLVVGFASSNSTIVVYSVNGPTNTCTLLNSTEYSALPGTGGGITYSPKAAQVYYGFIVIVSERFDSGNSVGISAHYSQDQGETWAQLENSATDGGGFDIPTPASYGSNVNGSGGTSTSVRGREWMLSAAFPRGGIDEFGNFNKLEAFFGIADYILTGSLAKGVHFSTFKISRSSETSQWTVGKVRSLYDRYEATATGNLHGHSVGMTGSGYFLAFIGDSAQNNSAVGIAVDLDDYETASITATADLFGDLTPAVSVGKQCPQAIGCVPGPDKTLLTANDTWYSPILRFSDMESDSDPVSFYGPAGYRQGDILAGIGYKGWEVLFLTWYPGVGYLSGGLDSNFSASLDPTRHYSPDGINWVQLTDTDAIRGVARGTAVLAGKYVVGVRGSDENLMIAPVPRIETVNTLLLGPGLDNKLTTTTPLAQFTAPAAGNTRSQVTWDGSKFIFASDSTTVANAPSVQAPLLNPKYLYINTTHASSGSCGAVYLQESSGASIREDLVIGMPMYVANLSDDACGFFSSTHGGSTATNDRTPERTIRTDWTSGYWLPVPQYGDPVNNNTNQRGAMVIYNGISTTPNVGSPMLLAIGGLYESELAPYPCGPLTTSNPNELEVITLPPSSGVTYSVAATFFRPEMSATIGTAKTASGPLFTIFVDADNYVLVYWDGTNERIQVTATVDGVAGTTRNLSTGIWLRDMPLTVMVSDDGTDLHISALTARLGVVYTSGSGNSLGAHPASVKLSNADGTSVYNLEVAAVGYNPRSFTESGQDAELRNADFLFAVRSSSAARSPAFRTAYSPVNPPIHILEAAGVL